VVTSSLEVSLRRVAKAVLRYSRLLASRGGHW
jgi:hypothetical protein